MSLFVKAVVGAVMVLLIALVSRSRSYYIAGLAPLFPTFALIAHYIVGTERSVSDLKTTVLFGLWGVIPYCIYLGTLYFLADRLELEWALTCSLVAWCAAAAFLVLAWNRS